MSKRADLNIRLARTQEREDLEALQWRASLANEADRPHLEAHPDAIELPAAQIASGQVWVAELDGKIAGFAAVLDGELDGLFVEPELWRCGVGAALVEAADRGVKCGKESVNDCVEVFVADRRQHLQPHAVILHLSR